jgi:hypothetical protein
MKLSRCGTGEDLAPTFGWGFIQSLLTLSYGLIEEAKDKLLGEVIHIC